MSPAQILPFIPLAAAPQCEGTPLHLASNHGHLEVVRVLLDHGANKDATDEVGAVEALACCPSATCVRAVP